MIGCTGGGDGTAYLQGKITLNGQPYLEPLPIYIEYAGFRDTQVFSGGEYLFPNLPTKYVVVEATMYFPNGSQTIGNGEVLRQGKNLFDF